jgi:predicted ATPase
MLDSDQSGTPDRHAPEPAYRLIGSGRLPSSRTQLCRASVRCADRDTSERRQVVGIASGAASGARARSPLDREGGRGAESPTPIIGREYELRAVRQFVDGVSEGPASVVLDGQAGIGKTGIWKQAVLDARTEGVAVRTCQCSEADAGWAFAGLGDLLEGLGSECLVELPEVQRSALSAALLLSDVVDGSPGDRVVGVAVLGVLRALARSGPLVLAVDDIQWLDASSRKVLSFALRRLSDEPVRLIASLRTERPADTAEAVTRGLPGERIVVGPVSIGILQRIVQARLRQTLARPTLIKLHQATGGNPMMCLEMARALQRRGREPAAGEPLPIPADLRVLVTERLRGLSEEARELLLLTAALAQPTMSAVIAAVGNPKESKRCLAEAVGAGILELDGERVRFTHPFDGFDPLRGFDARHPSPAA